LLRIYLWCIIEWCDLCRPFSDVCRSQRVGKCSLGKSFVYAHRSSTLEFSFPFSIQRTIAVSLGYSYKYTVSISVKNADQSPLSVSIKSSFLVSLISPYQCLEEAVSRWLWFFRILRRRLL
jgi:hypothetical protein